MSIYKAKVFDNHNDWECSGEYSITNKKTGMTLWTGNGFLFLSGYRNNSVSFNLIEKFIIWGKIQKMLKRKLCGLDK